MNQNENRRYGGKEIVTPSIFLVLAFVAGIAAGHLGQQVGVISRDIDLNQETPKIGRFGS